MIRTDTDPKMLRVRNIFYFCSRFDALAQQPSRNPVDTPVGVKILLIVGRIKGCDRLRYWSGRRSQTDESIRRNNDRLKSVAHQRQTKRSADHQCANTLASVPHECISSHEGPSLVPVPRATLVFAQTNANPAIESPRSQGPITHRRTSYVPASFTDCSSQVNKWRPRRRVAESGSHSGPR